MKNKTNKTFSIDLDLYNRLKEEKINASELVCELLTKHFYMEKITSIEELLKAIKQIEERTDISLDEKNKLLKPLLDKKAERDREIQKQIKETAIRQAEQIERERLEKIRAEEIFKENELKFVTCSYCQISVNLNNIIKLKEKFYCMSCKDDKIKWGKILDLVYYNKK